MKKFSSLWWGPEILVDIPETQQGFFKQVDGSINFNEHLLRAIKRSKWGQWVKNAKERTNTFSLHFAILPRSLCNLYNNSILYISPALELKFCVLKKLIMSYGKKWQTKIRLFWDPKKARGFSSLLKGLPNTGNPMLLGVSSMWLPPTICLICLHEYTWYH